MYTPKHALEPGKLPAHFGAIKINICTKATKFRLRIPPRQLPSAKMTHFRFSATLSVEVVKDTIFMVGIPWKDFPAGVDTATYTAEYRTGISELAPALFAGLRAKFPGTTIIENIYGTAAVELRLLFDQGKLPDVKQLTGDKATESTSLFKDSKGHAGAMLLDLAPLLFLKRIYGVDPSEVSSDFSEYSTDLKAVAQSVLDAQDAQDAFRFCAPSDASCPGRSGGSTGDAGSSTTPGTTAVTTATCTDRDEMLRQKLAERQDKPSKVTSCSELASMIGCSRVPSQLKALCCATCPTGEGGTSASGCVIRRGHRVVHATLVATAAAVLCNMT